MHTQRDDAAIREVQPLASMPPFAASVTRGLDHLNLDYLAYVPSTTLAPIIKHFRSKERPTVLPLSREEDAVGIIGALPLAGRNGAILMQDNGFGNAITALSTFTSAYHLPILVVANSRGGLGEFNTAIHTVSDAVEDILEAINVRVFRLDRRNTPRDWESTIHAAGMNARVTRRPVVVLADFWAPPAHEERHEAT